MRSILMILMFVLVATNAHAKDRLWLGKSRLWTNDEIGDRKDRWRTGGYSISHIRGTEWTGQLPTGFGDLVEYRIHGEVVAPRSIYAVTPPTDRRLAGVLRVGAFTHMRVRELDVSMGIDLVFVGPQTGMANFQSMIHQGLGYAPTPILGSQLGDAIYPTFSAEISRAFTLSANGARHLAFRPYLEMQAGVETYLRAGGDFTFGNAGLDDFQVRDITTGHRTTAIKGARARGVSFLLGGDVALVQSSQLLPTSLGPAHKPVRSRLRAGIYVEDRGKSLLYGLTWLSPEFVGQPEGQVVGSFSVRFNF